jgi:hypothetical protein
MLDWRYRGSIVVLVFTIGSLAFGPGLTGARPPSMASEGPAPDLAPVRMDPVPNEAREGERFRVTVTIENKGDMTAWSASVKLVDRWPSGAEVQVAEQTLSSSVGPGASVEVPLLHFVATEVGEHTLTARVVEVTPTDENPSNNALSLHVTVLPSNDDSQSPPAGDLQIEALQGLGIAGLFVIVALAVLGVAVAVAGRGRPEDSLVPPPPEPPDRRPPPIWPP